MAKILMLEKYKGEIEGEHTSVYIATDVNMNRFMSFNLALKQDGDKVSNDIQNTKWIKLPEERYKQIAKQLQAVHQENYLVTKDKPLLQTPSSNEEYRRRSR